MRILENNEVLNSTVTVDMPYYQRLFFATNTLVVGDVVTGSVSLVTGGIVVFIGTNWIDIKLVDNTNFYHPYPAVATTETLTAASGNTLTSIADTASNLSGRPKLLHPDFSIDNIFDNNRNLVIPSKSYLDNLERNFDTLSITAIFPAPKSITCMALVNHNFSQAAVITVKLFNGGSVILSTTIANPNITKSLSSSYRSSKLGTNTADSSDTENIPILYLGSSYLADAVSITIEDTTTTEPYIYLGILYVGTYWQPSRDVSYGWDKTLVDTSNRIYAQSPYAVERPKYSMYNITMSNMTPEEMSDWVYIFDNNGIHSDIIVDLLHYSAHVEERSALIYGRFGVNNIQSVNEYFDRYTTSLQFRESI